MAVSTGVDFPSTQWSLIACLQSDGEGARQAANTLAARYWTPVYAYLVNCGMPREQAGETTQAFFTDVVLGRGIFERARPEVGRLRGLMRTALRNYVKDLNRAARQRFENTIIRLSEHEDKIQLPLVGLEPDDAFDRRWALALFQEAVSRCEQHFRRRPLQRNWAAFEAWIVQPAMSQTAPDIDRLCKQLGFRTPADLRAAVQTVKKRVLSVMHDVVAEQVTPGEDPGPEYQEVINLLRGSAAAPARHQAHRPE